MLIDVGEKFSIRMLQGKNYVEVKSIDFKDNLVITYNDGHFKLDEVELMIKSHREY